MVSSQLLFLSIEGSFKGFVQGVLGSALSRGDEGINGLPTNLQGFIQGVTNKLLVDYETTNAQPDDG